MANGDNDRCRDPHDRIDDLIEVVEQIPDTGNELIVQDEGVTVAGGPHTTLDFRGSIVAVTDQGGGVARVTITATAGSQNLFDPIALTQAGGGVATGDTSITASSPTTTLTVDAGANITLTGDDTGKVFRIDVTGIYYFSKISVAGETDVVADATDETLVFAGTSGIRIDTTPVTNTLTWSLDAETFLATISEGPGIDISGTQISVDLANTDPCLEFDVATGVQVKIKEDGGLERTSDGIQDKWRYHRMKGLTKGSSYTPSLGSIAIDNVESLNGEEPVDDPADEIVAHGLPLYANDNEEIHAEFCNDGAEELANSWTTDTMENLPHILAGFPGYDPTKNLVFVHDANQTSASREEHGWKERTQKTVWGLDPDGGHTIITSGTTLTLKLKVTKYTFEAINVTEEDSEVSIVYTGTECS